ncbi:hypothetical protein [Tropicimonas sp. IMCC6043]|uniref:hypothetical protein n=1 Tax=Tropicimonas sp. IMCC6043 TaxID=2510645 RepID=UPI001F5D2D90|nr:hypothetical protein [Tropicimonas sp. IMCC6043]
MAYLPGPVHLVAETPHLYAVGPLDAVRPAQVGPGRAARVINIFQELPGILKRSGAEIYSQHHLDPGQIRPSCEFVGADPVGFRGPPGQIQPDWPFVHWPNSIFPIVGRDEISARVANGRDIQVANEGENVLTESMRIGGGMAGLEYPGVDCPPHVFDERGVKAIVYS